MTSIHAYEGFVSEPPDIDDLRQFLASGDWKTTFSETVLTVGYKMARAKQVTGARAEILDTGDIEIIATVIDKEGHQDESTLVFWTENDRLKLDTSCSCAVGASCHHCTAVIEHLSRPNRLETAFGEIPESSPAPSEILSVDQPSSPPPTDLHLHFHVKRNPDSEKFPWLPEIYATATVSYGDSQYPLDPAGNISPPRNRAAEITALNLSLIHI